MHRDAETQILSLAWSLEEPDRSAFIKAATEAVEKLGPNAYGPGAVHRLLAPLWRQFFRPPSETSPTNRSRAYHPDDDGVATALTKLSTTTCLWRVDQPPRQRLVRPIIHRAVDPAL